MPLVNPVARRELDIARARAMPASWHVWWK
jgi:hypothetical protein